MVRELGPLELATSWVDPDDGLVLLGAEKDHVVVRRHDYLARLLRVVQDDGITRAARWGLVALVADVTRSDTELPKRTCDTPREQFVEEQPDGGSPRRGATSYWAKTFAASS